MSNQSNNGYLKFWGVRGTFPITSASHSKYGGNTSCIELMCGDHLILFDAGTGLKVFGDFLLAQKKIIKADILISHTHLDHILGIPFFKPFYASSHQFRLWAGHLQPERLLKDVLSNMMTEPFFPIPIDIFKADIAYNDFNPKDILHLSESIKVETTSLNHPNRAIGYRVNYNNLSICYVTDTEHQTDEQNAHILKLIQDADYFIYDATYTDNEFELHRHWGHSSWQEGYRLAKEASVKNYIIFHHDPDHDDQFMDKIALEASSLNPNTIVAYEGLNIKF
ncbi:MAG: MBL fold metallo-hydrolase [Alphaproteobacteria bacterium]|nr:MBL fold metallo-hydrolase [Alphaproteobacteria bacterium]